MKFASVIVLVLAFVQTSAFASAEKAKSAGKAKEPALALSIDSPEVKWGPGPEFLPKGAEIAVLHGDPSKKNADIFLRIPSKAEIANHWHTSAERMILVSGELQVAYEGQEKVTLKPGHYAYGPAKRKHSATCQSEAACVLFIAFELPVDAHPVKELASTTTTQ